MCQVRVAVPMLLAMALIGCQGGQDVPESASQTSVAPPRPIQVIVDPRIELLSAVQQFNSMYQQIGLITREDFPYKREMMAYFAPYSGHEAVRLFNEMADSGFNFDAPPTAILHLSLPPELKVTIPFTDYVIGRAKHRERLDRFVAALRDFAAISDFNGFWTQHQAFYDSVVAEARSVISVEDYAGILEQYYGNRQHGYYIIHAPILHNGGYGPRIMHPDGGYDVYQISGPSRVADGRPIFWGEAGPRQVTMHEFSHSFVNPVTELQRGTVDSLAYLFEPISERMRELAYGDWETCVNEHLVRAVTTRMAYRFDGPEAGDAALKGEQEKGFVYIAPLVKALESYESNRAKYQTFRDYYPELMKTLAGLKPSTEPL